MKAPPPPHPFEYSVCLFLYLAEAPFETMHCNNHCICLNMAMDHTFSNACKPDKYYHKQGVSHSLALPFTLQSIIRQKKNYGNSNISPCKSIIFKLSSKRNQNPPRYYNSITNLQHKPKYHLSKTLI